jgi:hypothetical protein
MCLESRRSNGGLEGHNGHHTGSRRENGQKAYEKSLAGQWREVGCAAGGAPYVLQALIARLSSPHTSLFQDASDEVKALTATLLDRLDTSPFQDGSHAAKALAAAFLDEAHCAGAHGLSEADKAELIKIRDGAAPQAPKP